MTARNADSDQDHLAKSPAETKVNQTTLATSLEKLRILKPVVSLNLCFSTATVASVCEEDDYEYKKARFEMTQADYDFINDGDDGD
jgi:Pyruvate/2-oxoacid:ferredoxin oxidoreductase delta subunit